MPTAQERRPGQVLGTTAVVAAVVASGWWLVQSPLRSSRPERPPIERTSLGEQIIETRLWQDPLAAAQQYRKTAPVRRATGEMVTNVLSSISELRVQIRQHWGEKSPAAFTNLLVLQVMISGGPYPEDSETRMRSRYAVLSALGKAGYVPWDEEHIGCVEVPWISGQLFEQLKLGLDPGTNSFRTNALLIPFEWFQPNSLVATASEVTERLPHSAVLVMWLTREAFEDHPTKRLFGLIKSLWPDGVYRPDGEGLPVAFKLLDPSIRDLVDESFPLLGDYSRASISNTLNGLDVFSTWATTADVLITTNGLLSTNVALEADVLLQDWPATNGWVPTNVLLNADVLLANNELVTTNVELTAFGLLSAGGLISTNITLVGHGFVSTNGLLTTNVVLTTNIVAKRREAITGLLKDRGMTLRNATCTDDDMARVLVDELERRGVKLVGNRDSVVLISEWDTAYGRALPLTFAAEVERRRRRLSTPAAMDERAVQIAQLLEVLPDLRNDAKSWPSNLLRFSYLRGVDGRLPGEGGPKPAASQSKSKGSEMGELDRPEGQSQLDYVPRLALEIRELDLDVRRKHKRGVRAIGVLGSDVYDKLLLLQSLHDLFPGVVFFTTDLDARLSHPSELEWSRNLIVASSFDMEADRETQNPTPPFRDTYQTAQYLACLEAVGYSPAEWLNRVEARLFEIGRRGPYVLDAHGSPIYPKRANGLPPFHAFVAAFLACILGLGLVLHFGPALRRWLAQAETLPRWQSRSLGWALGILLMLAIVLMSAMVWDHRQEWGEPFSILDGVSLWPAEIIRFIALVASCCLFGKALDEMKQSNHTLAQQFELPPLKPRRRFSLSLPARWRRLLQSYRRHPIIHRAGRERSVNARGLWRIYQCRGRFCHRLERSLPAAAGYWLIALCLIFILPIRFIPYRGWVSLSTDWLFSTLSFVLLVLLTFLVVDATLLCRWFIQTLSEQPTIWPEEVLKRESKARNMQPEDLREWLDVKCIAERTKTVGQLIYYPFLVLLVLIAARSSYFDQWDWPISVLLMYGIISMFAIYCASTMLRTAENARQAELAFLRGKLLVAKGNDDRKRVEQLRQTIEEIENVREGAFAPLTQQPVVRVLLLVPGGTGLLSLAEVLARSF